ncbi:AAA family ATPase [Bacillus bombysepticus]
MRINSLYLSKYKNLNDVKVSFSESDFAVFIGNNGSGKSNLLEAIVLIFKGVYTQEESSFEFEIDYNLYDNRNIFIKTDKAKKYVVKVNDEEITLGQLKALTRNSTTSILPRNILVYYSGHSTRLANFMNFSLDSYISNIKKGEFQPRHFFYLYPSYFPLALLSILGSDLEDVGERIKDTLNIKSLDSFSIKIDRKISSSIRILSTFEDALKQTSDRIEATSKEATYYFNGSQLKTLISNRSIGYDRDLFKFLDISYCTGALKDIQVNCILDSEEKILVSEFSEGEQQFLIVNAIIEFFGYKDTLYLFDEPDTFYHPKWQREFLNQIKQTGVQTQFVITTHSPLMLSSIQKKSIHIMQNGRVYGTDPNGSMGRDVNGILSEIMDVPERPHEVKNLISKFYEQSDRKNRHLAKNYLDLLRDKISNQDPFLLEAESILTILEIEEMN